MTDGDLTLKVGGKSLGGWTEIQVTMGIERCPNDFVIAMTEKFPGEGELAISPGEPCQVLLGSDLVITGYIDRVAPFISAGEHGVQVSGRGKCQDLVDCSAEWQGGQISGSDALGIASKLAKPYGISVSAKSDVGGAIPQFNIMISERAFEIIERIGRWRGFLAYELPDGSLALAQAGSDKMASGVAEGKNVQRATAVYAMDQRYSSYRAFLQSFDSFADTGEGGNLFATVTDPGCTRHRQLDMVAETGQQGLDIAKKRVAWEAARRAGRSQEVTVMVDSWRDADGELWKPNAKVPVDLPSLKVPKRDWVIGQVVFHRGSDGTSAELSIMPHDAYVPQPDILQPIFPDL